MHKISKWCSIIDHEGRSAYILLAGNYNSMRTIGIGDYHTTDKENMIFTFSQTYHHSEHG